MFGPESIVALDDSASSLTVVQIIEQIEDMGYAAQTFKLQVCTV